MRQSNTPSRSQNFRETLPLLLCLLAFFPGKTAAQTGCSVEASLPITINPKPTANFTVSANGLTASFSNTSANGTTFSWNFGDGSPASAAANPTHVFPAAGTFPVVLTVSNNCGTASQTISVTVTTVGTFEVAGLRQLKIYPNPIFGEAATLTLDLQGFENEPLTLVLTDLAGREISRKTTPVFSEKMVLETGGLPVGTCFVQVWQGGKMTGAGRFLRL